MLFLFVALLCSFQLVGAAIHPALHAPKNVPVEAHSVVNWCHHNVLIEKDALHLTKLNSSLETRLYIAKLRTPVPPFVNIVEELKKIFGEKSFVRHFGTLMVIFDFGTPIHLYHELHNNLQVMRLLQRVCVMTPTEKIASSVSGSSAKCLRALVAGTLLPATLSNWSTLKVVDKIDIVAPEEWIDVCCADGPCGLDVARVLAESNSVMFVEPHFPVVLTNAFSRGKLQSGIVNEEPLSSLGIQGTGYVVGAADTGIDHDHCFFYDPVEDMKYNVHQPNHRKIVRYSTLDNSDDAKMDFKEGHGTHVCGSIAGEALDSSVESAQYHGVVPKAKLSFYDLSVSGDAISLPNSLSQMFDLAYSDGARVHSNSWGSGTAQYTAYSQTADRYCYAKKDMLLVFAAGNEADKACENKPNDIRCDRFTVIAPSTAKNALSVGASMAPLQSWEKAAHGNFLVIASNGQQIKTLRAAKADFGPLDPFPIHNVSIISANPFDVCGDITNHVAGKVALALRGTCHFLEKAQRLQDAGATAMLLVNNIPGDPIIMGAETIGQHGITIPCYMIGQNDGALLQSWMTNAEALCSMIHTDEPDPHKDEENLSSFSSHGPTSDFRYKPDIVAVGEFVHSAYSDASLSSRNCDLFASMGTSMATPLIAGTAVMIKEYFERGFYGNGQQASGPSVKPTSALLKALLVQSAVRLSGMYDRNTQGDWRMLNPVPSFEQGFGIPRLNKTLPLANSGVKLFFDQSSEVSSQSKKSYCISYSGGGSFEATLVWTDPPSTPSASFHLINNLDLVVTTPQGQKVAGNSHLSELSGTSKDAETFRDVLNNVEKVVILQATEGTYTVTVEGAHIVTGSQDFALVANGAQSPRCSHQCALSCVHGSCSEQDCVCEVGWSGSNCSEPISTLVAHEKVTAEIEPMDWVLLKIPTNISTSTIELIVESVNPLADPDIFVTAEEWPKLHGNTVTQETTCDNCQLSSGSVVRKLSLPADGRSFYLGVIAMCCFQASIQISLVSPLWYSAVNSVAVSDSHNQLLIIQSMQSRITIRGLALDNVSRITLGPTTREEHSCNIEVISSEEITCVVIVEFCARNKPLLFRLEAKGAVLLPHQSVARLFCATEAEAEESSENPATSSTSAGYNVTLPGITTHQGLQGMLNDRQASEIFHSLTFPQNAHEKGGTLFLVGGENWMANLSGIALVGESGNAFVRCSMTTEKYPQHTVTFCSFPPGLPRGVAIFVHPQYDLSSKESIPVSSSVSFTIALIPTLAGVSFHYPLFATEDWKKTLSLPYNQGLVGFDIFISGNIVPNNSSQLLATFTPSPRCSLGDLQFVDAIIVDTNTLKCSMKANVFDKLTGLGPFPLRVTDVPFYTTAVSNLSLSFQPPPQVDRIIGEDVTKQGVPVINSLAVTFVGSHFAAEISVAVSNQQYRTICRVHFVNATILACGIPAILNVKGEMLVDMSMNRWNSQVYKVFYSGTGSVIDDIADSNAKKITNWALRAGDEITLLGKFLPAKENLLVTFSSTHEKWESQCIVIASSNTSIRCISSPYRPAGWVYVFVRRRDALVPISTTQSEGIAAIFQESELSSSIPYFVKGVPIVGGRSSFTILAPSTATTSIVVTSGPSCVEPVSYEGNTTVIFGLSLLNITIAVIRPSELLICYSQRLWVNQYRFYLPLATVDPLRIRVRRVTQRATEIYETNEIFRVLPQEEFEVDFFLSFANGSKTEEQKVDYFVAQDCFLSPHQGQGALLTWPTKLHGLHLCEGDQNWLCFRIGSGSQMNVAAVTQFRRADCLTESDCHFHGNCSSGSCVCTADRKGNQCQLPCPHNEAGAVCSGNGECSHEGECLCNSPRVGFACQFIATPLPYATVDFASFSTFNIGTGVRPQLILFEVQHSSSQLIVLIRGSAKGAFTDIFLWGESRNVGRPVKALAMFSPISSQNETSFAVFAMDLVHCTVNTCYLGIYSSDHEGLISFEYESVATVSAGRTNFQPTEFKTCDGSVMCFAVTLGIGVFAAVAIAGFATLVWFCCCNQKLVEQPVSVAY